MNGHNCKNYFADGGNTLVIGGKLKVEDGAEVSGMPTATPATPVKVTEVKLTADAEGKITGGTLTMSDNTNVAITVAKADV